MSDDTTDVLDVPVLGLSRVEAEARGLDAPFGRDDNGDPLAPFGHRLDGAIKLKPGRKAGEPIRRGPRGKSAPSPRRRPTSGSSSPSRVSPKRGAPDYRDGIRYVGRSTVEILTFAGLATDEAFIADAVAAQAATEPLAEHLNRLAPDVPWLAKALEYLNRGAPYAGLSAALTGLAAQLVANHVPAARPALCGALGLAVDPEEIIAQWRHEAEAATYKADVRRAADDIGAQVHEVAGDASPPGAW